MTPVNESLLSPLPRKDDPIWLMIFFNWVETSNYRRILNMGKFSWNTQPCWRSGVVNVDQCWFRLVDHPLQSCSGWFRAIFFWYSEKQHENRHRAHIWATKKPVRLVKQKDHVLPSLSRDGGIGLFVGITINCDSETKLGETCWVELQQEAPSNGISYKIHPLKHGSFMNLMWPQQQVQNFLPSTDVSRTQWLQGKVLRLLDIYSLGFQTPCVWM